MRSRCRLRIVAVAVIGASAAIGAELGTVSPPESELRRPFVPMVRMETDQRSAPEEYARRAGIGREGLRARHGATGLVRCSDSVGTAQLTLRADLITTAAHVLIGADGHPRSGCMFKPTMGIAGEPVPVDMRSVKAGSTAPLAEPATRDWAVARLAAPVRQATPYALAAAGSSPTAVMMCAGGNRRADGMGTEHCSARRVIGASPEGIREIAIDCNAAPGSSGAAVLGERNAIVAIYVGYRSTDPERAQAYSATHYNFAITVEGPFRRAVMAAAAQASR